MLKQAYPELVDVHLPTEANANSMVLASIRKRAAGDGTRIIKAIWDAFEQHVDLKFVMVFDEEDVKLRDWHDVIWAITTRMDPARDTLVRGNAVDDLESLVAAVGSKMGLDATNKWPGESTREWGTPISKDPAIVAKVDDMWSKLGL
ncbi:hypothetical protein [Enterovibrio nigricans]|uniref:hypothetical protein n=1 Tax=Enterovibrio nigricans TaxID=504469 RepID=UPI003CC7DD18